MAGKNIDWSPEVAIAMEKLKSCDFRVTMTFPLIDYLASHEIVPRTDLLKWATNFMDGKQNIEEYAKPTVKWTAENFIATTLAAGTRAIHGIGEGDVPKTGGWYFWDEKLEMYLLDRGFGAEWLKVHSKETHSD